MKYFVIMSVLFLAGYVAATFLMYVIHNHVNEPNWLIAATLIVFYLGRVSYQIESIIDSSLP